MMNLKANNALHLCTTFNKELDLKRILRIRADYNTREYIEDNINALKKEQGNDELIKALQKVLDRPQRLYKMKKSLKLLLGNLR